VASVQPRVLWRTARVLLRVLLLLLLPVATMVAAA
jgi:hypothetical protein